MKAKKVILLYGKLQKVIQGIKTNSKKVILLAVCITLCFDQYLFF